MSATTDLFGRRTRRDGDVVIFDIPLAPLRPDPLVAYEVHPHRTYAPGAKNAWGMLFDRQMEDAAEEEGTRFARFLYRSVPTAFTDALFAEFARLQEEIKP